MSVIGEYIFLNSQNYLNDKYRNGFSTLTDSPSQVLQAQKQKIQHRINSISKMSLEEQTVENFIETAIRRTSNAYKTQGPNRQLEQNVINAMTQALSNLKNKNLKITSVENGKISASNIADLENMYYNIRMNGETFLRTLDNMLKNCAKIIQNESATEAQIQEIYTSMQDVLTKVLGNFLEEGKEMIQIKIGDFKNENAITMENILGKTNVDLLKNKKIDHIIERENWEDIKRSLRDCVNRLSAAAPVAFLQGVFSENVIKEIPKTFEVIAYSNVDNAIDRVVDSKILGQNTFTPTYSQRLLGKSYQYFAQEMTKKYNFKNKYGNVVAQFGEQDQQLQGKIDIEWTLENGEKINISAKDYNLKQNSSKVHLGSTTLLRLLYAEALEGNIDFVNHILNIYACHTDEKASFSKLRVLAKQSILLTEFFQIFAGTKEMATSTSTGLNNYFVVIDNSTGKAYVIKIGKFVMQAIENINNIENFISFDNNVDFTNGIFNNVFIKGNAEEAKYIRSGKIFAQTHAVKLRCSLKASSIKSKNLTT